MRHKQNCGDEVKKLIDARACLIDRNIEAGKPVSQLNRHLLVRHRISEHHAYLRKYGGNGRLELGELPGNGVSMFVDRLAEVASQGRWDIDGLSGNCGL